MPWLFFVASLAGGALTLHAFRPLRAGKLLWPAFFAAWLTSELALHHVAWQLVASVYFIAAGALESPIGLLACLVCLFSWGGLVGLHMVSRRASVAVGHTLRSTELHIHPGTPEYPRLHVLWPPAAWHRRDVEITKDVPFAEADGRTLFLDVFRARGDTQRRPAVIQVHGGAWRIGHKRFQGVPLLGHLAANGWVGFNVDYRLSPDATFPDHLIDLKRAVAWIREHADDLGIDPDFIAVTGGSAGGHLAALLALTPADRRYQPGFEDADTSIQAAVTFYGVYDFTNRLGTKPRAFRRFLEEVVMKRPFDRHRAAYRRASPLDQVGEDAPPFFVIHGEMDTIAPAADARLFVEELRRTSGSAVAYAEIHGAQHAFDVFPSVRCIPVFEAAERFLHAAWAAYLHGGPTEEVEAETERAIADARVTA